MSPAATRQDAAGMPARLFPMFADLRGRRVLVVGGGTVAERKARLLLDSGARLSVGAPALTPVLRQWHEEGRLVHLQGEFDDHWLQGQRLVIAATNDATVNHAVATAADAANLFVNVVDDAELSSFQVPAVVDRAPLVVAISSGGAAPMLARRVRARLEALLEPSLGPLARLLHARRTHIRARLPDLRQRRAFYDGLLDGDVPVLMEQAREGAAAAALDVALGAARPAPVSGRVTLVGAGPGNPGLLTLDGLRALGSADVILFDRLCPRGILDLARRDADFIDVGKQGGGAHVPQAHTNALMLAHARTGAHVVRLKGGDPFVFGRGGEELEFLRAHGVPYRVVPGITAALACAAHAGIPLTHRAHAQSVRLVTAHCRTAFEAADWQAMTAGRQTLAVYMGVRELPSFRNNLIAHGLPPATPFALVENGGLAEQRLVCGALDQLVELAQEHRVRSPALLIVGPTAALAERLHWYGEAPLTAPPRGSASHAGAETHLPPRTSASPTPA